MSKYDPLSQHLRKLGLDHVRMKFEEIEKVLGFPLPPSSRKHRAWWSNNPSNNVMTHAWIDAGYMTEDVDLEQRRLVFRRGQPSARCPAANQPSGMMEQARSWQGGERGRKDVSKLYGCLRGTVTFIGDVDLTKPADPEWGEPAGDSGGR